MSEPTEPKERYPDILTPEKREIYERVTRDFREVIKPMLDEIRRSEILTAKDFAITINAR